MIRAAAAMALAVAGCDGAAPPALADCGGDLRGVWRLDGTDRRYHAIAGRDAWELFPMFDDTHPAGVAADLAAGPGVIDLARAPRGAERLTGTYARRFERAGAICTVTAPVVLHGCRGGQVTLEVAPPQPPVSFAACASAPPGPAATWRLVRQSISK